MKSHPAKTDAERFFLPLFEAFKNASNQKHARQRLARRFYFVRRFREAANDKIFCNWNNQTEGFMKLDTLRQLYINELRDLYNAENQLIKALPKMAKAASSKELREALEEHLEQTKGHVDRLEQVFARLDEKPKGKTCRGMKGLIEEGSEILEEGGEESVLDAGIIVAAQKVEHYEIAGYGSVRTFANLLGENEAAGIPQTTLDGESEADELLTGLAERIVNPEAFMEAELAESGSRGR